MHDMFPFTEFQVYPHCSSPQGWKLADPICTFLFSILVLFSTLNVLKDALGVLMEGTR